MSLAGGIGPYAWARARGAWLPDYLLRVDTSDPAADTTGGVFNSIPNSGTGGGDFTAAGALRPTVGTQNSRAVAVESTSQYLSSSLAASAFAFLHNGSGTSLLSLLVIPSGTVKAANVILSTMVGSTADIGVHLRAPASGAIVVLIGNGIAINTITCATSGTYAIDVPLVVQVEKIGALRNVYVNGVLDGSGTIATPSAVAPAFALRTGYTSPAFSFSGKFCELSVISGSTTPAQRAQIRAALLAKWIP